MSERPAPSFAVTAASLLRNDRAVDAARLCASGLQYYPDYAGGYILLAKAYDVLGQPDDARLIRNEASRRFAYVKAVPEAVPVAVPAPVPVPVAAPVPVAEAVPAAVAAPVAAPVPVAVPEPVAVAVPTPVPAPVAVPLLVLIDSVPHSNDQRIIKSSSVRLIPGLEYTTLRFEGMRSRGRREIAHLSEPPAFREFHTMRRTTRSVEQPKEQRRAVSLEELAHRLEKARMPRQAVDVVQSSAPAPQPGSGPTVVTETIARIYMQQGNYERAIEAFRTLQTAKPEKHTHFEQLIAECERART